MNGTAISVRSGRHPRTEYHTARTICHYIRIKYHMTRTIYRYIRTIQHTVRIICHAVRTEQNRKYFRNICYFREICAKRKSPGFFPDRRAFLLWVCHGTGCVMVSASVMGRITRHGTPAANTPGGISRVTTLPAPMTLPSPTVTPPQMVTLPLIQQLF